MASCDCISKLQKPWQRLLTGFQYLLKQKKNKKNEFMKIQTIETMLLEMK